MNNVLVIGNMRSVLDKIGISMDDRSFSSFYKVHYLAYDKEKRLINNKWKVGENNLEILNDLTNNVVSLEFYSLMNIKLLDLHNYMKEYDIKYVDSSIYTKGLNELTIQAFILIKTLGLEFINEKEMLERASLNKNNNYSIHQIKYLYSLFNVCSNMLFAFDDSVSNLSLNLLNALKLLRQYNLVYQDKESFKKGDFRNIYLTFDRLIHFIGKTNLMDEDLDLLCNLYLDYVKLSKDANDMDISSYLPCKYDKRINTAFMNANIDYFVNILSKKSYVALDNFLQVAFPSSVNTLYKRPITSEDLKLIDTDKLKDIDKFSNIVLKILKRNSTKELNYNLRCIMKILGSNFNWNEFDSSVIKSAFPYGIELDDFNLQAYSKSKYDYYLSGFDLQNKDCRYIDAVGQILIISKTFLFILLASDKDFNSQLEKLTKDFSVFINGNLNKYGESYYSYILTDTIKKSLFFNDEFINEERTCIFFKSVAKYIDSTKNKTLIRKFICFLQDTSLDKTIGDISNYSKEFKSVKMEIVMGK